jgi:hypothetical protein
MSLRDLDYQARVLTFDVWDTQALLSGIQPQNLFLECSNE